MIARDVPWRAVRHQWPIYLFILPTLVMLITFQYVPAGSGIFHSFFRWNGADIAEYVGLDNYRDLLSQPDFFRSFRVAFIIGLWNVFKMVPALLVAVCIHRCPSARAQFIYRALFVVPMVIPGLVVALVWRSFFFDATGGYLNRILESAGLLHTLAWIDRVLSLGGAFEVGHQPMWLGDPRLVLVAVIVWGFPWVGSFAVLTHLAKLQNIPKDIYEAGDIDGTNWWTRFTTIELPTLAGSIYVLLVFLIIDTVKDAGVILALAGFEGGPGGVVTVPALFMIRKAFVEQQMGYACSIGIVLTAIVMLLQKLSDAVINWEFYSKGRRAITVIVGTLVVGAMLAVVSPLLLAIVACVIAMGMAIRAYRRRPASFDGRAVERHTAMLSHRRADVGSPSYTQRLRRSATLLASARHATILFVLALAFVPVYLMVVVSLKDNQQFYQSPGSWTPPFHFANWSTAWQLIRPSIANSIFISSFTTVFTLVLGLGGAYFFARLRMPFSGFLWNAILLLMMMPAIANLVPLFILLRDMHLLDTLSALILVGASGGQIFAIFVLRNFLADVPNELFEAADVDGASHFAQLRIIVAPLVAPVLGTVGVMQFVNVWNDFVLPLIVINDPAKLPVMVQLLRMAGEYIRFWGPLMAGYALASVPVIVLFVLSMRLFVRGLSEGAVKG